MDTSRRDLIEEILRLSGEPPSMHDTMRVLYASCEMYELYRLRDSLRIQHRIGAFKPPRRVDPQVAQRDRMIRDFPHLEAQGHG